VCTKEQTLRWRYCFIQKNVKEWNDKIIQLQLSHDIIHLKTKNMELAMDLSIKRTTHSKLDTVDWDQLEFGKYVSDHMFSCTYKNGRWQHAEIVPFSDLSISPATLALHYGQSVFEGMKAFAMQDGQINIFRIDKHHQRLNRSLRRMCMPSIQFHLFANALVELVKVDKNWMPTENGSSLYLRPFVFASEAKFGVKISDEYKFIIFSGPVPSYYQKRLKIKVERSFIRAGKGGTGFAKCAGNYGGTFYPTQLAREEGYDQVMWTDSHYNEYIEESGTMNVMFVIDGTLVTPPLSDSILDGVTRDSLLQIAAALSIPAVERPVGVTELKHAFENNKISEAFGVGTAAVVASISTIGIDGVDFILPEYSEQSIMNKLKAALEGIRTGNKVDDYGWNFMVD
jgi:branched-chain amino acid aminotransferase